MRTMSKTEIVLHNETKGHPLYFDVGMLMV